MTTSRLFQPNAVGCDGAGWLWVGASSEASSVPGFRRRPAGGRPPQKRPSSPGRVRRDRCSRRVSFLVGSILLDPLRSGTAHSGVAGSTDLRAAAVMLVIGGDVPDRGVQAGRVVLGPDPGEFGVERGRIGDPGEMRPVALQATE